MYNKIIFISLTIIILILVVLSYKNHTNHLIKIPNNYCPIKETPLPIEHYYNKNHDSSSTIIVSHFTLNNKFIMPVIRNHRKYAKQHNYDYWFRNGIINNNFSNPKSEGDVAILGLHWQKLIAIKEAMDIMENSQPKYNRIIWVDGDAVFTNFNVSLEDLKNSINVTNKHYFIIAKDMCCKKDNVCPEHCCINTGVLLIRNNKAAYQFIKNIIDSFPWYKNTILSEQTAIQDQIFGLIERKNNKIKVKKYVGNNKCNLPTIAGIKIVDPHIMNSGYISGTTKWKAGDFIAHFAGTSNKQRNTTIPKFLSCINNAHNKNLTKCEYKENG